MWLVKRLSAGLSDAAPALSDKEARAVRAAYLAEADDAQMEIALNLLHRARKYEYWIACDCRAPENLYPVTAPVLLTATGTYFFRRLTGAGRPNHREDCVFHFERREGAPPLAHRLGASAVTTPTGYFSVLSPEGPAHLSEHAPGSSTAADRRNPPKLARYLWRLLTMAGANEAPPVQSTQVSDTKSQFSAIRAAAERLEVRQGTALARVLALHPQEFHSRRLYARIRSAKKNWPDDTPPQGFFLFYAREVKGNTIYFKNEDPIDIVGELARPAIGAPASRAPYLVLAVVGEDAGGAGLAPLRAYAQPVLSGAQLFPVDSGFERQTMKALDWLRKSMADSDPHLEISLVKPLFDLATEDGSCRPDLVLEITDMSSGEIRTLVIETMEFETDDYLAEKARQHELMASVGRVVTITSYDLDHRKSLIRKLAFAIRGEGG